jgi:Acetamidase/Formamidase family
MSAIRTAIHVDLDKPASSQPHLHNRWHPDIPTFAKVKPGEPVNIECVDWTGGQIKNDDSADDILNVDLRSFPTFMSLTAAASIIFRDPSRLKGLIRGMSLLWRF